MIFVTNRFLFCTVLFRIHYHITGLILECKKDASLAVKTTEGEEGSQVQDLICPPSHKNIFFPFCGGV